MKGIAFILTSPIRVMGQASRSPASKPGHGHCIGHKVSCYAGLQRPANDLAIKQVKNEGHVESALIRPKVVDVGLPDLMRCAGLKVPIKQVLCQKHLPDSVRRNALEDFDTLRVATARIIGNSTFACWAAAFCKAPAPAWAPMKLTLGNSRDFYLSYEIPIESNRPTPRRHKI